MKIFHFTAYFLLLKYCLFNQAYAESTVPENPQTQLKDISQICLLSPFDCLRNIDEVLLSIPQESRIYFEVLQYKLEALFNLKQRKQLNLETKKWLNNPDLPPTFQIANAIYYAKSSSELGKQDEANKAYLFAKSLLKQVNHEYPSPLRLVLFANLQMQLKDYDAAYQLMLSLAKKYPKSPDTRFMVELHGNLGHAANQLGDKKQALNHWLDAKKWVLLFNNKQQIGVILFNLGDIYEQLKQYNEAKENYLEASIYAKKAGDHIKANQSRYRLLKVRLMTESVCQNDSLFLAIEPVHLPEKLRLSLNKLSTKLIKC